MASAMRSLAMFRNPSSMDSNVSSGCWSALALRSKAKAASSEQPTPGSNAKADPPAAGMLHGSLGKAVRLQNPESVFAHQTPQKRGEPPKPAPSAKSFSAIVEDAVAEHEFQAGRKAGVHVPLRNRLAPQSRLEQFSGTAEPSGQKVPGLHAAQVALPGWSAWVPSGHGIGADAPASQ